MAKIYRIIGVYGKRNTFDPSSSWQLCNNQVLFNIYVLLKTNVSRYILVSEGESAGPFGQHTYAAKTET